jgi:hypothetical protein
MLLTAKGEVAKTILEPRPVIKKLLLAAVQ